MVDSDNAIREFIHMALTDEGYTVALANDPMLALRLAQEFCPDVIILDMRFTADREQTLINALRAQIPSMCIIGLSTSRNLRPQAVLLGVNDFIEKPFDLTDLIERISNILR